MILARDRSDPRQGGSPPVRPCRDRQGVGEAFVARRPNRSVTDDGGRPPMRSTTPPPPLRFRVGVGDLPEIRLLGPRGVCRRATE